jgi:hypothetical protein
VLASRAHRAHPDAKRRHLESWAETSVKSIAELLSKTTGKSDIAKLEKTCQEKLFSRHLTALGTLVFDLMGIAQESITDHDYKVSIVPAGSKYDAQTMVQKGSPPPPAGAHAVLCPMGLGMRRVVSTVSNTPRPHNSRIIPSPPEEFTIMLPEVLLPYTVNDSPGKPTHFLLILSNGHPKQGSSQVQASQKRRTSKSSQSAPNPLGLVPSRAPSRMENRR